jgi:hypothetical protein
MFCNFSLRRLLNISLPSSRDSGVVAGIGTEIVNVRNKTIKKSSIAEIKISNQLKTLRPGYDSDHIYNLTDLISAQSVVLPSVFQISTLLIANEIVNAI